MRGLSLAIDGMELPAAVVRAGVRVNVARAFDRPWRFTLAHPTVSALTRHPNARA